MDGANHVAVTFMMPSGKSIDLDPRPSADDSIADIRRRLALALGRHHLQVRLYCGEVELTDGDVLAKALPEGAAVVTVITRQLDAKELKAFIKVGNGNVYDEACEMSSAGTTIAWMPVALIDADWFDKQPDAGSVKFPPPRGVDINMLPFIMGHPESLPDEYRHYWPLIEACRLPEAELGKVGYLTIQEGMVPEGEAQRRPGVHIETPGLILGADGRYHKHPMMWGCGFIELRLFDEPDEAGAKKRRQGLAEFLPKVEGGLYMASNVDSSCNVWNALITDPGVVVGHHGDLEHVREQLGQPRAMRANEMYWLTDRTPHESLPMRADTHRQFFRLVTSSLSAWFPDHSSENRLGTVPDPSVTKIIAGSKFASLPPSPPTEQAWRVTQISGVGVAPVGEAPQAINLFADSGWHHKAYGTILRGTRHGLTIHLSDGSGCVSWDSVALSDGISVDVTLNSLDEIDDWNTKWCDALSASQVDASAFELDTSCPLVYRGADGKILGRRASFLFGIPDCALRPLEVARYPVIATATFTREARRAWPGAADRCLLPPTPGEPPLPPGWEMARAIESGKWHYLERSTGETSRDRPDNNESVVAAVASPAHSA